MSGRADVLDAVPELAALARANSMVLSRRELAGLGITGWAIDCHLQARRWREECEGVLVLHCGPLTVPALRRVAVLAAGPASALCAWTALALRGLGGWERSNVHVVVPRGRHVPALDAVTVHESRRHRMDDVRDFDGLPAHSVERAAIDAAAWSPNPRTACGLLAAVVQQGLSVPTRLSAELDTVGSVRHRRLMMAALGDIGGGAQALSEIDVARLCRRAGLPEPVRQRVRRDANGRRRYLDAEWDLGDGGVLGLEIDGVGHMAPERWYDDLMRQAELLLPDKHLMIRIPATAARIEPARLEGILRRALLKVA